MSRKEEIKPLAERWREKYYDKVDELNTAEVKLQIAINTFEEISMLADDGYSCVRHDIQDIADAALEKLTSQKPSE